MRGPLVLQSTSLAILGWTRSSASTMLCVTIVQPFVVLQSTHRRCALRCGAAEHARKICALGILPQKYALCLNTHPSLSLSCSLSVFLRILAALAVYDLCITALSHVLTTNSLRSLRIFYLCNVLPMVSSCNVSQICGPSSQYMHTHTHTRTHTYTRTYVMHS